MSQFFWKSLKIRGRKTPRLSEAENQGKNTNFLRGLYDGVNNNVTINLAYENVSLSWFGATAENLQALFVSYLFRFPRFFPHVTGFVKISAVNM